MTEQGKPTKQRGKSGPRPRPPELLRKNHNMRWSGPEWADAVLVGPKRIRALVTQEATAIRARAGVVK